MLFLKKCWHLMGTPRYLLAISGVFVLLLAGIYFVNRYLEANLLPITASVMEMSFDAKAEELRPLSLAERRRRLDALRTELAQDDDAEDAEHLDAFMKGFITAMNDRGVYFE